MTVSVLLRLVRDDLGKGKLAGEAEVVATGERAVVRDAEELVAFVRRAEGGRKKVGGRGADENGKR